MNAFSIQHMQSQNWKTAARNNALWEANEDNYAKESSNGARAPTAHLARLDREIP